MRAVTYLPLRNSTQKIEVGKEYTFNELCDAVGITMKRGYHRERIMAKLSQYFEFEVIERPNKRPKYTYLIIQIKIQNDVQKIYHLSKRSKYINDVTALFALYLNSHINEDTNKIVMTFNMYGQVCGIIPYKYTKTYQKLYDGKLPNDFYKTARIDKYPDAKKDVATFFTIYFSSFASHVASCMKSIDKLELYTRKSTMYYFNKGDIKFFDPNECDQQPLITEFSPQQLEKYKEIRKQLLSRNGKTDYSMHFNTYTSKFFRREIQNKLNKEYPEVGNCFSGYEITIHPDNVHALLSQLNVSADDLKSYKDKVNKIFKEKCFNACKKYYEENKIIVGSYKNAPISEDFLSVCAALLDYFYD